METEVDRTEGKASLFSQANPLYDNNMKLFEAERYEFQQSEVTTKKPAKKRHCIPVFMVFLLLLIALNSFLAYKVFTLEAWVHTHCTSADARTEELKSAEGFKLGSSSSDEECLSNLCGKNGTLEKLRTQLNQLNVSAQRDVKLMCLEQGESSLERHLELFLDLAHQTTFPDYCLCTFLYFGLSSTTRAQLSGEGPRGSFESYVEWVLASCGSPFTVEVAASPTPQPVPSQNHPDSEDFRPEPTAGSTTETAAIEPPTPTRAIRGHITTEPEQCVPDQVCEPADSSIAEGVLVDLEGPEMSPAHPPATESGFAETLLDLRCGEETCLAPILSSLPLVPSSPELPVSPLVPSSVPLPPSHQHFCDSPLILDVCIELQPVSQSTAISATQSSPSTSSSSIPPPLSSVVPSRACRDPPLPGHEEPEAPPPASGGLKLPPSIALTPAPALLPPSTSELTTPDSLGTSASPGSDIASPSVRTYGPFAVLWPSTPSTAACSALPQAPSPPSVAPARLQTSGSPPRSQEVVTAALSQPLGSSPSLHLLSSSNTRWVPSSPLLTSVLPMAVVINSPMAPPSINATVGHYSGWCLAQQPAAPVQGHLPDFTTSCTTLDLCSSPPPG